MIPSSWSWTEDVLPLLAFGLAFVMILRVPVRRGGMFNGAAKAFFATSVACYFISTGSSILNHFDLFPAELDPVITSIELLWVPLILFGVYAVYSNQQVNDAVAARHEVVRSSQMLESVMDTTPAGVVVLNGDGMITFANPEARRLLDMEETPGAGSPDPPWTVLVGDDLDADQHRRPDFHEIVASEPLLDVPVAVSWPNGWRRRLIVNTTPVLDDDGVVSGAVAAFVEREPWSPVARVVNASDLH